jgi:hypothetical protein
MCNTPWCFGECDECEREAKNKKEYEEATAECPYRKECNIKTVHVKQDRCSTCGKTFNYA